MQLWIIIAVSLAVAEMLTGTFYLLALSAASILPIAFAYFDLSFQYQALSFGLGSLVTLFAAHKMKNASFVQKDNSNLDQDVGKLAIVSEVITDSNYRITHRGTLYSARSLPNQKFNVNDNVLIVKKDGNEFWISNSNTEV